MKMQELEESANSPIWDNEPCRGSYIFPLPMDPDLEICKKIAAGNPDNETVIVGQFITATSPQSHIGPFKHAIDFLVPDGTEVLAASDGIIIEAILSNNTWGNSSEFRDSLNFITIEHPNGEFTQYCHLAQFSLFPGLAIGSHIKKGQPIARTGKTGWTDRDHLHFIVFRMDNNSFKFKSLKVDFDSTR